MSSTTKSSKVRVRFAPSPTGLLHLGNLRAALFNYLYAKHTDGAFIVRIEDTDQGRLVPEALPNILEALAWYGLDWDEGPELTGGERGSHGPYTQSKRLDIYRHHVNLLLQTGVAYHCFCSPKRLEQVRKDQMRRREPPRYDGRCRALSPQERLQRVQAGESHVVRMAVPREGSITFTDLIRGTVSFEDSAIDDQVLMKSDGYPTYHLANVVDDHLMEITHVIRAEEWLPSTPKHILLFKAFGWNTPAYAHVPMILGPDRSKLSKRHGAESALSYREQGFLPHAVINYIAFLGWNPGTEKEHFSLDELTKDFSLNRVNPSPAIFDSQKLLWMNGLHIRALGARQLVPFVRAISPMKDIPDDELAKVIAVVKERITTLRDIEEWGSFYFKKTASFSAQDLAGAHQGKNAKNPPKLSPSKSLDISQATLFGISDEAFSAENLRSVFQRLMTEQGLQNKDLLPLLRFVISSQKASPDVFDMISCLGKARSLSRVGEALEVLRTP